MFDPLAKIIVPSEIERAIENSKPPVALVISISGGKDSDTLCEWLPRLIAQRGWSEHVSVSLAHTDMGMEWFLTPDYLRRRATELGLPLTVARLPHGDLLTMFRQRHEKRPDTVPFPSAAFRYCTSAKVAEIDKHLRHVAGPTGTVICAVGIRAAESPARAKKPVWGIRDNVATRTRRALSWNPIHAFSTEEVWDALGVSQTDLLRVRQQVQAIRADGGTIHLALAETGFCWHGAYALGNDRLSCSVCFLGSRRDILNGIEHHPDTFRALVQLEIESGYSYRPDLWLAALRPDLLDEQQRQAFAAVYARRQAEAAAQPKATRRPAQPTQLALF